MQPPRQGGIVNFPIRELASLQACYMPFVTGGGLFIPSNRQANLGDDVFVVTSLPGASERIPLTGKVIWVATRASNAHPAGFAIQLLGDEGRRFKDAAEKMLTGLLNSERPTFTI